MRQIHLVIRRVNPALKIDLVQIGCLLDGQFKEFPLTDFKSLHALSVIKNDSISDSCYIHHSDVSNLVVALSALPGFSIEFFDNTLVVLFYFNLEEHEIPSKEEGQGN